MLVKCPQCAEQIQVEALRCRFCNQLLSDDDKAAMGVEAARMAAAVEAYRTKAQAPQWQPSGCTVVSLIFAAIFALVIAFGPRTSGGSDGVSVTASDQKAYDALKSRGYSDTDAQASAASVRRLCEAAGGHDCQ